MKFIALAFYLWPLSVSFKCNLLFKLLLQNIVGGYVLLCGANIIKFYKYIGILPVIGFVTVINCDYAQI